MDPKKPFKIIIAGGGVAGLTLATMLDKFGIDYILLEAHKDFAPQVGASIALLPNGLRILDQLGIYEPLMRFPATTFKRLTIRSAKGEIIMTAANHAEHLRRRFGYNLIFFDRQWLLKTLYEHLDNKDRLLPNQKISRVQCGPDGVSVATESGEVFHGSILIGADGVHSAVREEMFRIGHERQPGYFTPGEPDRVPCYYQCSFGIAQNVPGWVRGDHNYTVGQDMSQLIVTGPENRVYWFLFRRLPAPRYGKDIPKYSKGDDEQFRERYRHVAVTDTVVLGDIFDKRLYSVLTPLHEVVYEKWFFQRIFIMGDAAHKPNPLGGQGGNGAMETAAEFVNALLRRKEEKGLTSFSDLTGRDIERIFAEAQAARQEGAQDRVNESHTLQALCAFEHPLKSSLALKCLALVGDPATIVSQHDPAVRSASRLEKLPVPHRPHALPWSDDLKAKPIGGTLAKVCQTTFAAGFLALSAFAWRSGLDNTLSLASWSARAREGTGARLELLATMTQLVAPLVIYTIEGNRLGNVMTPLSYPGLATVGMAVKGAGVVGCLHNFLTVLQGAWPRTGRFTPLPVAKSILPSIAVGYLLPLTGLVLSMGKTQAPGPWWSKVLLFAPPLFSAVSHVASRAVRWWSDKRPGDAQSADPAFDRYESKDVPILRSVYLCAGVLQASAHIAGAVYLGLHPTYHAAQRIPSTLGLFQSLWNGDSVGTATSQLLRSDIAVAVLSWFGSNLYTIWDLRRLGYINTQDSLKAVALTTVGQTVVGPGATYMAISYWRESTIANIVRI